ncbi:MAG: GldG family protein [Anaerolineales bacterium]|nr:GldG family protein [Anaerolineales bacterium]
MQSTAYKQFAPWAAGLGLLGLVAAAIAALIYRQFNTVVQVALVAGLLGFVIAIFLSPGAVTQWAGQRQARYGANAVVMALAFIGIVVLVNYLVSRAALRWDLSEGQVNTLAAETVETLQKLPEPVKAVGFYSDQTASQRGSARELLDRYRQAAPEQFSYEFVDPYADPVRARQYNLTQDGVLFLEAGTQRQEISLVTETELTAALLRVVQPTNRTLYFLTGQGEADPNDTGENGLSQAVEVLQRQNYVIQPLNLQVTGTIPADARAIVIAGPQIPLAEPAVQALSAFLAQNQNVALVVLLDPSVQNQASGAAPAAGPDPLVDYLRTAWGLEVRDDTTVDLINGANTTNGQNPLWPVYVSHPPSTLTENLAGQAVVFPLARTLSTTTTVAGVTFTPVIQSDSSAWGETDLEALSGQTQPAAGPEDAAGPLTLAVTAEDSTRKLRLVVFGDSDFARNAFTQGTANVDLFVAAMNWATRDEALINLTPKTPTTRTLRTLDALTVNTIFLVTVVIMPALVLGLGGVVWFLRRRHS